MSFYTTAAAAGHCSSATPGRHHQHSKFRSPITTTACRRRRYRPPGTPFSQWKYDDQGQRGGGCGGGVALSARKLAAGLWQLRLLAEISSGCGGRVKFQPPAGAEQSKIALPLHRSSRKCGVKPRDRWQSPLLKCSINHEIPQKDEPLLPFTKSAMEGATKWDHRHSKKSTEAYYFYTHMKLLEDQVTTVSVVSALQAELVQAQLRILQLEDECWSAKKKFEILMRKLREERKSMRRREHHKMRVVVEDIKDELSRERKSRKKVEVLNSKLVKELADSKSAAKQLMQDYEKEKRGREIMEEVSNELAKKREDKTEMEALKRETMRLCEEVEQERRMLQLAEVWREERVQMKLVDAKLALEYKYHQLNKLVADIESFLMSSQSAASLDVMELRKAEMIREAVKSVNIQDIKEFEYMPSKSNGIFSVFEELQKGQANERGIENKNEPLVNCSPVGDASNYHIVHHEANRYGNNYELNLSNGFIVRNSGSEKDSRLWEAVIHAEDQGSRCSHKGSDASVSCSKFASIIVECNENGSQNSPNAGQKLNQKAAAVYKLSSSFPNNPKLREITSDDDNRRLLSSGGTISSLGTASPDRKSMDSAHRQRGYVKKFASSPDSENPHIMQGMKGFIEWPRGNQKHGLKSKLLKALMERQKTKFHATMS